MPLELPPIVSPLRTQSQPRGPALQRTAKSDLDFVPSPLTGLLGVIGFGVAVCALNRFGDVYPSAPYWRGLFVMACTAGPMLIRDARLLRGNSSSRIGARNGSLNDSFRRTATKFIGLLATCALLGLCYWVFPEYHDSVTKEGEFYGEFFALARSIGPWVLIACAGYFFWIDRRMVEPGDGYWHFGQVVLLRWRTIDRAIVANHLRTWAVKGFFLPLMFAYLCSNLPDLVYRGWPDFLSAFDYLHNFLFTIDLAFVTCGYVLTLRWVQSQVRSAEPTVLGWTAALMCYMPFWKGVGDNFLGYWGNNTWDNALAPGQPLFYVWGVAILLFETIFVWATISFGLRFSNLTHRGIVRTGPYYFTKHPAYVAKICAFLLIAVPWMDSRGTDQRARNCLMLAGLAFVYWIRAKTEERHLASVDPTYAVYAEEVRARHRRWFKLPLPSRAP